MMLAWPLRHVRLPLLVRGADYAARVAPAVTSSWELAIDGFFGPSTIGETLAAFYLFDLLVHRWDISVGTGQEVEFSAQECVWLHERMDGYGDVMYSDGMFGAAAPAPPGADDTARVLARTGRAVTP